MVINIYTAVIPFSFTFFCLAVENSDEEHDISSCYHKLGHIKYRISVHLADLYTFKLVKLEC